MRNTPLKAFVNNSLLKQDAKSALKQKKEEKVGFTKEELKKHQVHTKQWKKINPGTISQGKGVKGKFDRVKFHPEVYDKDYVKKLLNPRKHGYPDSDFSIKRKPTKWQ